MMTKCDEDNNDMIMMIVCDVSGADKEYDDDGVVVRYHC